MEKYVHRRSDRHLPPADSQQEPEHGRMIDQAVIQKCHQHIRQNGKQQTCAERIPLFLFAKALPKSAYQKQHQDSQDHYQRNDAGVLGDL